MSTGTSVRTDISSIARAIGRAVEHDRVTSLAPTLAKLSEDGAFAVPEFYACVRQDRYARRLIWRDPSNRFVIVGMTWGPGQFAALHDHAGSWGAEVVVDGSMLQTSFRLIDRDASGRYRFVRVGEETSGPGTVSVVLPPLEYHVFGNASPMVSRTVHVYGSPFDRCQRFVHDADGWWRGETVELRYDA